MRNLKKLLAVILAICVIATFAVPAFAEGEFTFEAEAQVLNDLGLYQGISSTTFDADLGSSLNRETGVTLLLRVFGLEADAAAMTDADVTEALAAYTDAKDVSSWALKGMAYAVTNGIVLGTSETTLSPKGALNGKMLCTMILRQLGYFPDYDVAPAQLADAGGLTTLQAINYMTKSPLIKDDLVGIFYAVLSAPFSDGTKVIDTLVANGVVSKALAVESGLMDAALIVSVVNPADITVEKGAALPTLPATVKATMNDGTEIDAAVTWTTTGVVTTAVTTTPIVISGAVAQSEITAKINMNVIYTAPTVVTAVATNNKQVVLTFSKDMDPISAAVATNYTASVGGLITSAVVSGKVVTLTLTTAIAQQSTSAITVTSAVKDATLLAIVAVTKTVTFFDAAVPTALSAAVTGPQTIKVTFSEPITSSAIATTTNFVVDANTYSVASVAASGDSAVVVTLGSTLPAGDHTITVNNSGLAADPSIKDYAGFYAAKTALTFTYAVDATAPTVALVSATQNTVKIKFSKPITANTGNLRVTHTYTFAQNAAYAGTITWVDTQNVTVTFATYLPVGAANIFVSNVDAVAANQLKDGWGNAFVNATLAATTVADATAPTVTTVAVVNATTIDVTYSEAVSGADVIANYTLKDSAAATIAISAAALSTGTTYRLTTASLVGGAYTLAIAGIKDTSVSLNAMAAYTAALTVSDLVKPTVTATGVYSTDEKKAVITFSESMNVADGSATSILNKSNYQITLDNGVTYVDLTSVTGATLTAGTSNKSVIITLAAADTDLGDNAIDVIVARVADAAGNLTAAFTTNVNLSLDDVVAANISTIKAINTTTVTFVVNTTLSAIDVSKFTLTVGGAAKTATSATYVNGATTATVTVAVAIADKFSTDLTSAPALTAINIAAAGLTTALGTTNSALINPVTTGSATIDATNDYVAPAVASVTTSDADKDGKIDRVTVVMTEAVKTTSVDLADFTVANHTVSAITTVTAGTTTPAIDTTTIYMTINELTTADTNTIPAVTMVGTVNDASAQANAGTALAMGTTVDGAAPALMAAVITNATSGTAGFGNDSGDVLTLVFSEAVNTNFAVATAPTAAELNLIFLGGALGTTANPFLVVHSQQPTLAQLQLTHLLLLQ